jgi:Flp pilus assembly protein TadG
MLVVRRRPSRRGAIAPLTAIFLIFLLGMLAFSMDMSWICLSQSELQNVADAAALAGAQQLAQSYASYNLPNQTSSNQHSILSASVSSAQSSAKSYAGYNGAGGVSSLSLLDGDISIGYTDANGKFSSYSNGGSFPNTVKVTMRRDSSANNPLTLFFAPVLGMKNLSLTASATATVYTGTVSSFNGAGASGYSSSSSYGLLPVTYDVNAWQNFVKTGKDPDGNKLVDSSGNAELKVYPSSTNNPGNFGELSLDNSHTGASDVANWITNGVSSSDIQALQDANLIPLPNHNANNWDWIGNTGFRASNVMTMNDMVGKTFWLPLFKPYNSSKNNYQAANGTGSNTYYNIVAFVPVKIMPVSDGNSQIVVQPASRFDANTVFSSSSLTPAGSSSSYAAAVMPPKLSN